MIVRPQSDRLSGDERGATALMTGLMMIVVLGFVGFGVDFGAEFTARRAAQGAADSAAYSAAVAAGSGATNVAEQGRAIAGSYGLKNGTGGVVVTVNTPPATGAFAGHAEATEVLIARPAPRFFSGLFNASPWLIRARAVAAIQPGQNGDGCVLALDPTDPQTLFANGSTLVNLDGCSIYNNSSNAQALSLGGSAQVTASSANVVGGYFHNGSGTLNAPLNTGAKPLSDPYADVPLPSYSGCNANSAIVNSGVATTFTPPVGAPFVFCNGLQINSSANVNFAPGVYIIDGGSLTFNGSSVVRGSGVTFILTNHTGSNIATATINGGADVNLSALTTGPTSGLVFYQDRRASKSGQSKLNGGSNQVLSGAAYFPSQNLTFNGGTGLASGGCTQLLAYTITFTGNSRVADKCDGMGTRGIGGFKVALVE
jgi:hypothetical protein